MDTRENSIIRKIGNEILDLIYPPGLYCISCGKITDDSRTYRLCNDCMAAMKWVTDRLCEKCGRPLSPNDPGSMCFSCTRHEASAHPHEFDKGHTCAGYGAAEQSVIFAFKYGGRSDIGDTLGEILYDRMAAEYGTDVLATMYDFVAPVPIYSERKSKRGFNHADLMAADFAKRAGLRCESDVLVRTRATLPMKGLGTEQRRVNIQGAFDIRTRRLSLISGARILLIDDIFTTGATIDEIARLLKHPYGTEGGHAASHPDHEKTADEGYIGRHFKSDDFPDRSLNDTSGLLTGASRVDFLTFAAAADMIV